MSQLRAFDVDGAAQTRSCHLPALFHLDRSVALDARDLERSRPPDELERADVLDFDLAAAMRDLDLAGNAAEGCLAAGARNLQRRHTADFQDAGSGLDTNLQARGHFQLQGAALPSALGKIHAEDQRR